MKSKTYATWLALLAGPLGAHRFYLFGPRDALAWLHLPPTLVGLLGALRMRTLGVDDQLAWLLVPVLGGMISLACLQAIVMGLTPDERWAERWGQPLQPTRWGPVLAVIAALLIGTTVLMGTIAFGGQKYFEYQQMAG
ncbi:MAG: hypothetical protein LCH73_04505 [Proteobacteria bacterium]|nr:hypothetical protein [Pseudomonadota bacterium]